jgi:DMSO/TMAO reductase YedYZ molybdopterin-dependent catalytic subunit
MPAQRLLLGRDALAREFREADLSPTFRSNGNTQGDADWAAHAAQGFARWSLRVDGLVKRPLDLPLTAIKAMTQRRQITRHDCVEGWSAIGQWQGPQLGQILAMAGLMPSARFVVFHCADKTDEDPYYESIDLIDAFHPQTILAWAMNGRELPLEHGAPVRLRVERQLGYKQAKYVMRIEVRDTLAGLYGGKGGIGRMSRGISGMGGFEFLDFGRGALNNPGTVYVAPWLWPLCGRHVEMIKPAAHWSQRVPRRRL